MYLTYFKVLYFYIHLFYIFSNFTSFFSFLTFGLVKTTCMSACSVQFSHSVVFDSLWPHGLDPARLPCPSPTPRACSNSCPSSGWCHPIISSSVIPFSSCMQTCPASGSFQLSQFFASGGQSIGVSVSALVLPMNIQDWFPLGLTGLTPCSPGGSQESSLTPQFKSINYSALSLVYGPTLLSIQSLSCN